MSLRPPSAVVEAIRNASYIRLSFWLLLVWDYAISFDQEVEYIWRGRKKSINKIYLLLRYAGLVFSTMDYFIFDEGDARTDRMCVVAMHMRTWPGLVVISLAEYVLAARVVVVWENSKWILSIVATAWVGSITTYVTLLALGSPGYSNVKYATILNLPTCVIDASGGFAVMIWRVWLTHLVFNALLGILVVMKGVMTYRREMLRGSHSQLRETVIRGSFRYYFIMIGFDLAGIFLLPFRGNALSYREDSLPISVTSMIPYGTVIPACRLILNLQHAYYQSV